MTQQSSRLDIIIDSRQAQRNGEQLRITLNNLVVVGDQTARSMDGAGAAAKAAGAAFAALGAGRVVSEIIRLTDAFKSMQGSLGLVSSSTSVAAETFGKLLTMANKTGSSLESTVSLYTRLANATRGAGYTTQQLLGVTDAINKAFVISGATMQEASNAAIQLSQGLASGTLRGEELNSVMEQGPRITRALAEYLGVTNGQIRQMAADGKITAEVVTNALLKSLSSLNGELERMPRRFEQASTALKNNFLAAVGQINIDPLISSVDELASSLAKPEVISGIQSIATGLGNVVAVGGDGLKTVVANTDALMAITGAYATKVGVGLVSSLALSAKARLADTIAANQQIIASRQAEVAAAAETVAIQSVVVASTEASLARAIYARSEAMATSQAELSSIRQMKAVSAQLAADRNLEIQRQKAQISNAGLTASHTRLAEIRTAEAAITSQLTAAEARLAAARQAELATGAVVGQQTVALNAARTEGAAILGAQTAAQNALNAAESRGAAVRGATMAAIGGPLGLITLGLSAAAAAYIYFSGSADTGTQSLIDQNLTIDETVKKFDSLTAAQQRNQASKWAEAQQAALDQASAAASKYGVIAENAITSVGAARVSDLATLSSMIAQVKSGQKTLDEVTVWLQSTQGLSGGFASSLEGIAAGYDTNIQSADGYAERLQTVNKHTQDLSANNGKLAASQDATSKANGAGAQAWDKYIEQLTKARDLVGANAAAEAAYTAVKMGANAAQQAQAKAIAVQTDLLNKYQDAVKENNKAEQERLKVLLVASYAAMQAAEDSAAAQKKALNETAKAAEESATRQVNAMQRIIDKSINLTAGRNLLLVDQQKQGLSGYGLLTNGGTAPAAPAAPRKTPQQMADEAAAQVVAGTTPNKPTKTPKGPSEKGVLSAAMSAFDALYKKADPAAQAVRDLTEAQEKLQIALSKGKITQEQYGVALGQASRDYAAVIAKTGELSQAEQYRAQILKQLQNQQDAANAAAAEVGMGSERAGREQERLKLEKETNDKLLGLRTELANAQGEKQRQALQAQIDITNEMYPQQVAIMENGWAQVDAAQANWMNGITAGWDNYQAKVADVAYQTETIMAGSLDTVTAGYGSAFSKMALDGQSFGEVTRGVFDNLARTVLDGLGQMGAQWLVLQGIRLAFGNTEKALQVARMAGISAEMTAEVTKEAVVTEAKVVGTATAEGISLASLAKTTIANIAAAGETLAAWLPASLVASIGTFGAAAVVGGGALLAAFALIKGFSDGGYTGPGGVNQPAGIVHKGEVVWSQADINRSGGVAAVEAMRRGDAMPAGISASGSKSSSGATGTSGAQVQPAAAPMTVQLVEDASKAGQVNRTQLTEGDVIRIYVANIFSEGDAHEANRAKYGLSSQGT
ncbi:tape measure protein [Pseudomonas sp. Y24-6]|uniref:tape measure protein n=1 Tax=Pseudomonas sp. Y24-6 TaxID=2750013 RepID=UPI001CE211A0|nr:tape measure protein [Pseudomonas sp. Y24-6]MCA4960994.1 tape measure protein [Pseudomonas sp. Y24-6]